MNRQPEPSAPVWILLGGLGQEAAHWGEFAAGLRAMMPGSVVFTPDYPGTGSRRNEKSPCTVDIIADTVRKESLALFGNRHLRLIGLSLGSMVALSWNLRYPNEVEGLVLLSGSAANLSAPWLRMKPLGIGAVARIAFCKDPTLRAQTTLQIVSSRDEKVNQASDAWRTIARDRPVSRGTLGRQLLAASIFRPAIRRLSPPPLVLAGLKDKFVDPNCSRVLARAIGAASEESPNAGHDIVLDDPQWVLKQIDAWIGRV